MPSPVSSGVNSQGNTVHAHAADWRKSQARTSERAQAIAVRISLVCAACVLQYTTYSNGGYSYNNAPSSNNNYSGSHYYSPSASSASSGAGFYTQNGGKSGGGYSFYQNSCARR